MSEKILFVGGLIKSGTTLLQRILDHHPDVCCLTEQDLSHLLSLCKSENDAIEPLIGKNFKLIQYFPLIVKNLLKHNCNKKIIGVNDNKFLLDNIDEILEIFENVKMIFIIRNPFDSILSGWDHWQRLSKLKVVSTNETRNNFLLERAHTWNEVTTKILNSVNDCPENIFTIKYEELVADKENIIQNICNFLEIDHKPSIIAEMIKETTFEKMKKDANDPSFYKEARTGGDTSKIDHNLLKQIYSLTIDNRKKLNYN